VLRDIAARLFAASLTGIVATVLAVPASVATADVLETFDTDPVAGGRAAVVGSNQSTDTAGSPAVPFVVSAPGVLTHNLNSNWRTVGGVPDTSQYIADGSRLHIPLGRTYTEADSFSFGATLRIKRAGFFWSGNFMQMSFGLVNGAATGMDRTSSLATFGDTYDAVEWDFFPDNTGANTTVQQVMFGTQNGAGSVFSRMAANFGFKLPVGAAPFDYGLPLDTWMDVVVSYDAATRTTSVTVADSTTGTPLVDQTSVPDLTFPTNWPGPPFGDGTAAFFAVDTLAVTNYQDAWAALSPSLVAEVEYDTVWFAEAAPPIAEPVAGATLALGLFGLAGSRRRRV